MDGSILGIMQDNEEKQVHPDFPNAPMDWTPEDAKKIAAEESLTLIDDHWDVIRALQEYCSRNEDEEFNGREVHDALDEKFHSKGGIKYLYQILPQGPVAQGSRLAGLKAPAIAVDLGFGSVM